MNRHTDTGKFMPGEFHRRLSRQAEARPGS